MKRLALLLPLALLAGCGGGPTVTQTRDVAAYTRLEIDGGVDVDLVPGDGREVTVTGGEDVLDRVVTESRAGLLRIAIKDRGIVIGPDPFDDVRVRVAAGTLHAIHVTGSADAQLGRVDAERLELDIDGSGDIEASGTVGALVATIEGSGDADLADLEARTARVRVEGSGEAHVGVTDDLDVVVEGSGDVSYRGNPRVRQRVEGSGEVRPAD